MVTDWKAPLDIRPQTIWSQIFSKVWQLVRELSQQVFKLSITARSESQVLLGINVHIERATSSLFQAEKEISWVKTPTIQSLGTAKIGTKTILMWRLAHTWGTFSDLRSGFLGPEVMQGYLRHHPSVSILSSSRSWSASLSPSLRWSTVTHFMIIRHILDRPLSPHGWSGQRCPRPCRRATCERTSTSPSNSWFVLKSFESRFAPDESNRCG